MAELAEVFARYGREYLNNPRWSVLPSHRRAIRDIAACRTPGMGGHVLRCQRCGRVEFLYHSCRNRSCPKCHQGHTAAWLEGRRRELLGTNYFHLVFTVPSALRPIIRRHQKTLYAILMKSAARALVKLAADPRYVGGLVGVLSVLHTWGRTLVYHPHVHCLVPAGGVSPDRTHWIPCRKSFLVPVRALSLIYRGMFRDAVGKELPGIDVPTSVWRTKWVVYCKSALQGPDKVLDYLARYVHRVALTNNRLVSITHGNVVFRYKDSQTGRWEKMTLGAQEFMRRFLQHVLPVGVHKVRYYGLWSPSNRRLLRRVQIILPSSEALHSEDEIRDETATQKQPTHFVVGQRCPYCDDGVFALAGRFPRLWRGPP